MKCHGLEMNGPIRSADGITSIEIENGTGKVIINNALKLNFGSPPTVNYDKTLSADPSGGASWQWRSFVKNTVALFAMPSVPTGWSTNNSFVDGSMLVYQRQDGSLSSDGSDSYTGWTTAVSVLTNQSTHDHTYSGTTDLYWEDQDQESGHGGEIVDASHAHTYSGTTLTDGSHIHGVTQDTFAPKYNTVIAGTKAG